MYIKRGEIMLKITKYSLMAITLATIIGCGGSDSSNLSTQKDINSYSDAEKLAYAIAKQKKALSAGQNDDKKSRDMYPCKNGGKMGYELNNTPVDISDFIPTSPVTIVFENCKDEQGLTNGKMKVDLDENDEGTISYLSDFTFEDEQDNVFIKNGGRVKLFHENGWEVAIINLTMSINGVTHGGENLIYRSKDLPDGGSLEYPVSGKEKIGDSAYFKVDNEYDASATPFKSNKDGELVSGLFKYKDTNNHAVELEITAKDVVTVRVDENGNGTFETKETSSIEL
jgi:hypothetical protein